MHIALVNQWYPPHDGGVSAYNAAMAQAYVDLGHDVSVVTARSTPDQLLYELQGALRIYRLQRWIEPYRLRAAPLLGRHVRTLRHVVYSAAVEKLLRTLSVDVMEVAEINAEALALLVSPPHAPLVIRCHTPHLLLRKTIVAEDRRFDTTVMETLEKLVVRRAAAVSAPSRDLAAHIEREMGLRAGRVHVIPNAIDVDVFSPGDGHVELAAGTPATILYVGRLGREKGVFVLADALIRLAAHEETAPQAPWRVIFAGDDRPGENRASNKMLLKRRLAAHGLAGRVHFSGLVSQEALIDLYRQATICVVPSTFYESFSYTALQAMACGRPLVASAVGGIPEVVVDGVTGLLSPPNEPVLLANALARLLADPSLRRRLGEAARARVLECYGHHAVAQRNLDLYDAVIRQRRSPRTSTTTMVRA